MGVSLFAAARLVLAVQGAQATLTGSVRDEIGDTPVVGAVVALIDLERSAVTDADGRYAFLGVPSGAHHVVARRIGYAPRTLHALVPRQGAIELIIVLRREPILLRAVEAASAGPRHPDRGVTMAAIRDHPLLAEPDALHGLGGGEVLLRPEAPSGLHVRGGAPDQIAYLLDGIPVLSPYYATGSASAWNPDALARVQLSSTTAARGSPHALSGVVSATTRAPGTHFGTQGSLSTTQARVAADGPLGRSGAGFVVGVRSGFPGFPVPKGEPSYLRGEYGDWLAKLEAPLARGRVRVLGYGLESELGASAVVRSDGASAAAAADAARNEFAWHSRSAGAGWTGSLGRATVHLQAWAARADAAALWATGDSARVGLRAERRDEGVVAVAAFGGGGTRSAVGLRTERSRTAYVLTPVSGAGRSLALGARTPLLALFAEHARSITGTVALEAAVTGAWAAGAVHADPRVHVRWSPSSAVVLSGEYARVHQFAQSLRNPESVVGTVFPVDLYLGANGSGVPVARSDQGVLAVEYRPAGGVRVGGQAYARDFDGLALVAPRDAEPFATTGFVTGAGTARGISLEVAAQGTRLGILATYGFQQVRLSFGDSSYVPERGPAHSFGVGATWHASPTTSVRVGASGLLGRRGTALPVPLEWEACNLGDQGCEFAGSPRGRAEPLGASRLPAYLRADVGVRKHWHVTLAGRDGSVAVFGTVTNVLGRQNVLTVAGDSVTGRRTPVGMRPRALLVAGIDWRF